MKVWAHKKFATLHYVESPKDAILVFRIDSDNLDYIKDFRDRAEAAIKQDKALYIPADVEVEIIVKRKKKGKGKHGKDKK